jgi:hypothetical protein
MISLQRDHVRFSQLDYLAGGILFLVTLIVFWLSPVSQVSDSQYSLLVSDSLLRHRTFNLDQYGLPRYAPQTGVRDDYVANGPMWQVEIVNNHLYYYFPPGSSILSLPFSALARLFGYTVVNPDGTYDLQSEIRLQKLLAAILMAFCVLVIFLIGREVLPLHWSVITALAAGLGTQIWSTTSRALWSHTWETLLVGIAILLLVRNEVTNARIRPVLLGTLAAWLYFVRPNAAIVIVALLVYLAFKSSRLVISFLLTVVIWFSLFVFYSWLHFGTLVPTYFKPNRLRLDLFPTALAGNLISPSRGLFIYVPLALFALILVIRFWRQLRYQKLVILSLAIIGGHVILISSFANRWGDWWGGASYGPRYTSELVPWFVLLAVIAVDAMRQAQVRLTKLKIIGGGLLTLSVFINARGALSPATWKWTQPVSDEQMRALLWDWRHPQFLAGLQLPPAPVQAPLVESGLRLEFGTPAVEKYLWYGWSGPEPGFRWTDGHEAAIVFRTNPSKQHKFRIRAAPFIGGSVNAQKVTLTLNGERLREFELTAGQEFELTIPASNLGTNNVLTFQLPNAASPRSLGLSDDDRLLGLRVEWLEFSNQ